VEFLTPLGWLVACAAAIPVAASLLRGRRDERVRSVLGLGGPGIGIRIGSALAATLAIALLAAAAARPAIRTSSTNRVRTDAQVFFVVDISRSMLAQQRPDGTTRFDRARAAAGKIASALADVPVGIASLTDRPLPHLFPTTDRSVLIAVLNRALGIQRPPPEAGAKLKGRATTFDPLIQLATAGYFAKHATHRLVILLTDGESTLYSPDGIARQLAKAHVGLLVLRFWHRDERVYTKGRAEGYRPDRGSLRALEKLTAQSVGLYEENELRRALRAARAWLGDGPTVAAGRPGQYELAPFAALAAIVPLAFVFWRRDP
jgi:hypothetical protein